MPLLQVGDRVLLTIQGLLHEQITMNTFLYRISAITGDVEYEQGMNAFHASLAAAGELIPRYKAATPVDLQVDDTFLQVIRPLRYRRLRFGGHGAGTFVGACETANLQASITRTGQLAGRSRQGGIRVPIGTGPEFIVDGKTTAALDLKLQELGEAMRQNHITAAPVMTFVPQIGVPSGAAASEDVWQCFPQRTVRVIRRRTVGLGI